MPLSERRNVSVFLGNTTATPFIYCRHFFKCFYCREQYSDVKALLVHTLTHAVPDQAVILKEHLPRGRRTINVDISDFKCRICEQPYKDLDDMRKHLTSEHKKEFTESGNGLVAYDLTTNNGQFSCHLCRKNFQTFILLNRHMNVHFSNAVCETCGAGFMTHQRLSKHKEIHQPGGYPCNKCSKVYTTSANLKFHIEKAHEGATKMRMLICPQCPERFVEHDRKLKHMKEAHGITFTFECEVCKAVFSSRRMLTKHSNKFHSEKNQCGICMKSFSCKTNLNNHRASHTGERNFVCGVCQKTYRYQRGLKLHMKSHQQGEQFKCLECGAGFQSGNDLNSHAKEWHPRVEFLSTMPDAFRTFTEGQRRQGPLTSIWEMTLSERQNASVFLGNSTATPFIYCRYYFKCFYCTEQYSDIKALLVHTLTHAIPDQAVILKEHLQKGRRTIKVDISDLKCRICKQTYKDLDDIRKHLTSEHKKEFTESGNGLVAYDLTTSNGQFSCHLCRKNFQTFILLNRHMNVHFSNAVCETCGAGFMTHQRLLQHQEIHLPGGYPCNKCSKVYTTSSNLKYHKEKAHEGATKMRMLRCPHCPERFVEHFRKLKHLKESHGITFTFECEVCNTVFTTRRSLTMHTNKFHSVKTQCGVCKKSFSCMTTLKKHLISHTGERNYVCGVCQKAYRHQKSLKQHMRTHLQGEQHIKFNCSECGSGFPSRSDFNRHIKEWHPRSYCDYAAN